MTGYSEFNCADEDDTEVGCTMKKETSSKEYPKTHTCLCDGDNCNNYHCDCNNLPDDDDKKSSASETRGCVVIATLLATIAANF